MIESYRGVSIGAVNGPEMLTLSGDTEPLQRIAASLELRGVFHRAVQVQVAYHSHHMEPIEPIMLESLAHVQGVEAKIALYSTVTGERADGTHLRDDYWYRNVREPVLFTEALRSDDQRRFRYLYRNRASSGFGSRGPNRLIEQLGNGRSRWRRR